MTADTDAHSPADDATGARPAAPIDPPTASTLGRERRDHTPQRIAHYRIIRRLGAGGMGVVFEAEQENPRRLVALKVINAGVASREALRRFQHEAHVLGRLHHPGIAQIYEAGTFDSGDGARPFFAMELIRGEIITSYAQLHELNTHQRLELLARVCDALQHAHLKAIIHRDLKPGNILVAHDGQPKVLDFGVARATDADIRATTIQTQADQLIGTLPYMSPEQAMGDSDELDVRSDVYALGVLGYELLTGRLPYRVDRRTVYEAVRAIREDEPTRLSAIDRRLRGDVETIFAKALEKDRQRRYQSAADFASDIRRFLTDEPIVARPASIRYRARKFARRNKALVIGVTGVLAALVGGVIVSTWFAIKENHARVLAQLEADKAQALSTFHRTMLSRANPAFAQGRDVTVREVLDQASRDVGTMFPGQPQLESAIRGTIGESYEALSEYPAAAEQFQRAAQLLAEALGEQHPETLTAEANLAVAWHDLGRVEDAIALGRRVLQRRQEVLGPDHEHTIASRVNLAMALADAGEAAEADSLLRDSIDRGAAALGESNRVTLSAMGTLASLRKNQGRLDEAAALFQRVIALSHRWLGENDHDTLANIDNYAGLLQQQGRYDEALATLADLLERHEQIFGPTHAATLIVRNNLAIALQHEGQLERAEVMFRSVVADGRQRFGEGHPDVLIALNNLAGLLYVRGELAEAERLLKEVLELQIRKIGETHPDTIAVMGTLAIVLAMQDKNAEAEPWYRRAVVATLRTLGSDHPQTFTAQGELAAFLRDIGRYDEAHDLFTDTLATLRRTRGDESEATVTVVYQYLGLLQRLGRWQEALPLSEELMRNTQPLPQGHPFRLLAPMRYGKTMTGLGRFDEAEASLMESMKRLEAIEGSNPQWRGYVVEALIELYDKWNKPEQAEAWRGRMPAPTAPDGER